MRSLLALILATATIVTTSRTSSAQQSIDRLQLYRTHGAGHAGHSGSINRLAFTSDSKSLASSCLGDSIRLWDIPSGESTQIVNQVSHAAFSPVSNNVAVVTVLNGIKVYELVSGRIVAELQADQSYAELNNLQTSKRVEAIEFSSDGTTVASAIRDGTITLWDVASTRLRTTLRAQSALSALKLSADGKTLASGHKSKVQLWDLATSKCTNVLEGHADRICSLAFSPDGTTLASGSTDRTVKLWNVLSGGNINTLPHSQSVGCLAFSPDGRLLATGSGTPYLKLWEIPSGKNIANLSSLLAGIGTTVSAVEFSPDGKSLAAATQSGRDWPITPIIEIWDVTTRSKSAVFPPGNTNEVNSLAFHPNGKVLASGGSDNRIALWNASTLRPLTFLEGHHDRVWSVAFSPDGNLLASACHYSWPKLPVVKEIKLWDMVSNKCIATFEEYCDYIAFSPCGKFLAGNCESTRVVIWDVSTHRKLKTFTTKPKRIEGLAFSVDGRLVASGGEDGEVRICNMASGQVTALKAHTQPIFSVAFSPDGKCIASASHDGNIKVLEIATGKQVSLLKPWSSVRSIAYSPDGNTLASVNGDLTIWDVAKAQQIANVPFGSMTNIVYSPDGRLLASARGTGIWLWHVPVTRDNRP